jgi:pantoate--beta-alanine ligase
MIQVDTVAALQRRARRWKGEGFEVTLVPTMGALHEGHLSLVRAARGPRTKVIASIFVNPLQFGPKEDFAAYPRTLDGDREKLDSEQVDVLFLPSVEEMYPSGSATRILPGPVSEPLEGERRPGHFIGVATVVARLLGASLADRAYFGQKDAQQLAVVRAMVADLAIPVEVVGCPTVREPGGLAMSSRNRYLDEADRAAALALVRALAGAQEAFQRGDGDRAAIESGILETLRTEDGVEPDYAALVDSATFQPAVEPTAQTLALVAARVGPARLIDNARLGAGDLAPYTKPALLQETKSWND